MDDALNLAVFVAIFVGLELVVLWAMWQGYCAVVRWFVGSRRRKLKILERLGIR